MPILVLLNGAPGAGKSTLADLVVQQRPMMLALDLDGIKHALGRWDDDPGAAGRHARRLAVALIREHLAAGYDVAVAQYLARTEFIEELQQVTADSGAQFVEVVLAVDLLNLSQRLRERQAHPSRHEHAINNSLVGPADAARLAATIEDIQELRPRSIRIDASGTVTDTLVLLLTVLDQKWALAVTRSPR
jgi:predicted kinase